MHYFLASRKPITENIEPHFIWRFMKIYCTSLNHVIFNLISSSIFEDDLKEI